MNEGITSRRGDKLHMVLFFYWFALLLWQNIRTADNRSLLDMAVKIGLLLLIAWNVARLSGHRKYALKGILLVIFFFTTQLTTLLVNEAFLDLTTLVSILFPAVFAFLFLIVLREKTMDSGSFKEFLKAFIAVVLMMCAWSIIFDWGKFAGAMRITSAYGNELSSFLTSSHEYGMYLIFAILSCVFCMRIDGKHCRHKGAYIAAIAIFSLNLILTYSRTSLFALAIGILCMTYANNRRRFYWLSGILLLGFAAVSSIPKLSDFIFDTMLKGNNLAGRDVLMQSGVGAYLSATAGQMLFGYGNDAVSLLAWRATGNSSFHNAYIEVLLTGGISMLAFLIAILFSGLKSALRCYAVDKYWGSAFLGLTFMSIMFMATNTPILCTSPIDSFCLTLFTIVFPRFAFNAIRNGSFSPAPKSGRLGYDRIWRAA